MLQSRNLHSARDLGLLIHQINERLGGRMAETASRADFDRIFQKPLRGFVEPGPRLTALVETITVKTEGPPDSGQLFVDTCKRLGYPASTTAAKNGDGREWASTGVRICVASPYLQSRFHIFEITAKERKAGFVEVESDHNGGWRRADRFPFIDGEQKSVADVEAYNLEAAEKNEPINQENEAAKKKPRTCTFTLVPIDLAAPIQIVDRWAADARIAEPHAVTITLLPGVTCERREEAIGVKIHDSALSLQTDGTLLWNERIIVQLDNPDFPPPARKLHLKPRPHDSPTLAEFQIEDLISTLHALQVIYPPAPNKGRRKS